MPKPQIDSPLRLLTIKDVAAFLQVSDKTVRRLIDQDRLPAIKLGAQWRIRPQDLDLFLRERRAW